MLRNTAEHPPVWPDEMLDEQRRTAINIFVDRRLSEPAGAYLRHFRERKHAVRRLLRAVSAFEPGNPDPEVVRRILRDGELFDALRYVAGPPISEDDLYTLVTRSADRLKKSDLLRDEVAMQVFGMICRLADPHRFPWIATGRRPRYHELRNAVLMTAAVHAPQTLAAERRGYGRAVEKMLKDRLDVLGLRCVPTPNGGKINAPKLAPDSGQYYGECTLYGRRVDILIGTRHGRIVAVESKDSNSAVNSVKRVANDTAGKGEKWRKAYGEQVVLVGLISGVFKLETLKAAQDSGLYLVWAHDLEPFIAWLEQVL
ncbi:XamI family restriction endonuclease [Azospirillum sp. TSO22-1]|uniref:XamI family restriction endonuclease n=1 Tax=Azospirillum sp. TSO22-1 TaxID=716789 RepID=UPI000D6187E3|nr:XamI family restriction endonuclease [Azospirillum sp. TSO22-1]PWC38912.1 hypothetical protein TSO221_25985 [Azospirillum sp. TSO22-1]